MQESIPDLSSGFSADERRLFIKEIAAAARDYKTTLGSSKPGTPEDEEATRRLQEQLQSLTEERAEFSPVLEVFPLDEAHFKRRNAQMSPEIADLAPHFKFYLVNVPVTLVPRPGWGFTELACTIEFNAGQPASERPVAHQVFPEEQWQNMISASQGLSIGLDENLNFKADSGELTRSLPGIGGSAAASAQVKAQANIVFGPFQYNVRRPKITARGKNNVKVYWRLDGEASVDTEDQQLGVVVKVPKAVTRVDISGALNAARSFRTFTADMRYLFRYLRERTRHFFEEGAPLQNTMLWPDVTSHLKEE